MRSRYTAFALAEVDYLRDSWHADFRPAVLEADDALRWIGLEIIASDLQVDHAIVEFEARLLAEGRVSAMRERSNFVLEKGRWFYTNGEQLPPSVKPWKPARNESCPCGSGTKFKRCCGAG